MTSLIDPRQERRSAAPRRRDRRWRGRGTVIEYDSLVGLTVLERVTLAGPKIAVTKQPRGTPRVARRGPL